MQKIIYRLNLIREEKNTYMIKRDLHTHISKFKISSAFGTWMIHYGNFWWRFTEWWLNGYWLMVIINNTSRWKQFVKVLQLIWNQFAQVLQLTWKQFTQVHQLKWKQFAQVHQLTWRQFAKVLQLTWNQFAQVLQLTWKQFPKNFN